MDAGTSALFVGNLEFKTADNSAWIANNANGTRLTSSPVQVGLTPSGTSSFTPTFVLSNGLTLNNFAAAASATTVSIVSVPANSQVSTYASSTQRARNLFQNLSNTNEDFLVNGTNWTARSSTSFTSQIFLAGYALNLTQLTVPNPVAAAAPAAVSLSGTITPLTTAPSLNLNFANANSITVTTGAAGGQTNSGVTAPAFAVTTDQRSFTAKGLSFNLPSLSLGYDPANNAIDFDAVAGSQPGSIALADSTGTSNSIQVSLGSAASSGGAGTHGLVFQNGDLSTLNATLGGNLTFNRLTLGLNGLGISYQKSTQTGGAGQFVVGGGATLSWGTSGATGAGSASIDLGTSGLVISAGTIQSVQAAVTGQVRVTSGVSLRVNTLGLSYASGGNFQIFGSAALTAGAGRTIKSISVALGDATNPGLVLQDGALSSFNAGVSGSFNLGGVTIAAQNLNLAYSSSQFSLSGGLSVALTDSIKVASRINASQPLVIQANGTVNLDQGFSLGIDTDIHGFHLAGSFAYATAASGGYNITTKATLTTPGGIGFDANLVLANGQLQTIGLGISAAIPVGETGLYVTWVYGQLNDINTSSPTVSAAATLTYGRQTGGIPPILTATGVIQISASGLILSADPTQPTLVYQQNPSFNNDHPLGIYIEGGHIAQFTGSLNLDWALGVYSAQAHGVLLGGVATVDAAMRFTSAGALSFYASASVKVPSSVPLIGGKSLGTANVRLEYDPAFARSADYVAAWGNVLGLHSIGFKYTFDGHFSLINGSNPITQGVPATTTLTPIDTTITNDLYFNVPYNTKSAQYIVSSPYLDATYTPFSSLYQQNYYVIATRPGGQQTIYSLMDSNQGNSSFGGQAVSTPQADPFGTYPGANLSRTSRLINIVDPTGAMLTQGDWKISVVTDIGTYNIFGQAAGEPKFKASVTPFPPVFVPGDRATANATAAQTDLDVLNVKAAFKLYALPPTIYTANLYATTTPIIPGTDPATVGVLVASQTGTGDALYSGDGVPGVSLVTLNFSVKDAKLPFTPNGSTPVYFYVVVNDGVNDPVVSLPSNPLFPPAPASTIYADQAIQSDFRNATPLSPFALGFTTPLTALATSTVSITATYGTIQNGTGSASTIQNYLSAGAVIYTPPASPPTGPDTITVTVSRTSLAGVRYTSTKTILVVPPNNVELAVTQTISSLNGNASFADGNGNVLNPPPAEGTTVRISLHATNNDNYLGAASSALAVTVYAPLPAGLTFVAASGGNYNPTTGFWSIDKLSNGAPADLTITATVDAGLAGSTIAVTARIIAGGMTNENSQIDVDSTNNVSVVTSLVVSPIAGVLSLQLSDSTSSIPTPLSGYTIVLSGRTNSNSTTLAQTTTDASGQFGFATPPGAFNYYEFRVYAPGPGGSLVTIGSAFPATNGQGIYVPIAVNPVTISGTATLARYPSSTGSNPPASAFAPEAGALVYLDGNNNSRWDSSETSVVTDASGRFQFTNLAPGTYTVSELLSPGRVGVASQSAVVTTVVGGGVNVAISSIDRRTISGSQFYDLDGNNIFDSNESGGAGWRFSLSRLTQAGDNQYVWTDGVASFDTDASGTYHFDNLAPGVYRVRQDYQSAYNSTLRPINSEAIRVGADGDITIVQLNQNANGTFTGTPSVVTDKHQNSVDRIDFGNQARATSAALARFVVAPLALAGPADTLSLATPDTTVAGGLFRMTLTVLGPDGNPDTGFVGTVQLGSTDDRALLPTAYTFTAADRGVHTFEVGLVTLGTATITATIDDDPATQAASDPIDVTSGAAISLGITAPAAATGGASISFALAPTDYLGNLKTDYWGSVSLSYTLTVDGIALDPTSTVGREFNRLVTDRGYPLLQKFGLDASTVQTLTIELPRYTSTLVAAYPRLEALLGHKLDLTITVTDPANQLKSATTSILFDLTSTVETPPVTTPVSPVAPPVTTPVTPPVDVPVMSPPTTIVPSVLIVVTFDGPTQAIGNLPIFLTVQAPAGDRALGEIHLIHFASSDPAAVLPPDVFLTVGDPAASRLTVRLTTPGEQVVTAIDLTNGVVVGQRVVTVRAPQARPAARVVDTLFQNLLGHAPPLATVARWSAAIARGAAPGRLASTVIRSGEFTVNEVNTTFQRLLGRSPSTFEATYYGTQLRLGRSLETVEAVLMGGREYAARHGNSRADFLAALAQDALGRPFGSGELATYGRRLRAGASHKAIALAVVSSLVARQAQIRSIYAQVLLRNGSPSEVARLAATASPRSAFIRMSNSVEFRTLALGSGARSNAGSSHAARQREHTRAPGLVIPTSMNHTGDPSVVAIKVVHPTLRPTKQSTTLASRVVRSHGMTSHQ